MATPHGSEPAAPSPSGEPPPAWVELDVGELDEGRVKIVVAENRALCVSRTAGGLGVLDNRCPHQGGPLGDGEIDENGNVICPWHGYEYDPVTGEPPAGFSDAATCYRVDERDDGVRVELPVADTGPTLMDQMVDVLIDWGLDTVFGMVGHSNLGMAEALRKAEEAGRLRYIGIRHEGAAAFAASGYGKVTGRPAACFSIAGPGATNLLTGLWDAKVDRIPILALTGQVQTQVLGPGAFQEIPLTSAFEAVSEWSQTVLVADNASELAALAYKHAVVQRDVAHLILPDDSQELAGLDPAPARPKAGRVAAPSIAPPEAEFAEAVALLEKAKRPLIIIGNGARPFRERIIELAERIDAPMITTFKAKGTVPDSHPLAGGVLGRSGTPIGSGLMARADALLVLGASFSNHTGIATWVPTIQVDFDRMTLGKFHPVDVPLWGELERTLAMFCSVLDPVDRPELRADVERRWERWRAEKAVRRASHESDGRMHPSIVFEELARFVPEDAVISVDVGSNTYAFGHYFECRGRQDVIMSGYLGSIGHAFPAAMGAWTAVGDGRAGAGGAGAGGAGVGRAGADRGAEGSAAPPRKVVSISGDGGFGQYLAEFTTAVKYSMNITHVLLNNDELGKISREQIAAVRPVWQTGLVNPDFAEFARLCGGQGFRADEPGEVADALAAAFAVTDGPSLVQLRTSNRST